MSRLMNWLTRPWRTPPATPTAKVTDVSFASDAKNALSGRGLVRGFGTGEQRRVVVGGVDIDINLGQIGLLMGPAGSGKSTLLAILSGLLKPEEGAVRCLGRDLWAMSPQQREVFRRENCGFVFQGSNLLPALSARKQLELVLRWGVGASKKEAADRAVELLTTLGMEKKMDLLPAAMSGGEKQRVAIARALVKQPRLLFADEPTSALDWEGNGKNVARLLSDAARRYGAMVLIVSHDPRLKQYADHVFDMDDGRLIEAVPTPDKGAIPHPAHRSRPRLSDPSHPSVAIA